MRGYAGVGLFNPKHPTNVGSALRACSVYNAAFMITTGSRYKRACTDTLKAYRHLPFFQVNDLHDAIPFDCIPIAVDLIEGATSLVDYKHPERAFYIFGPEDGTLGKKVTDWCRDKIYVPTTHCMNLAATINVVLYDRLVKLGSK